MDHFTYKNNQLHTEDVAISEIARAVGTPFYCYSSATLRHHYTVLSDALAAVGPLICFAVKANSNVAVLKLLGDLGAGADCVSEGEIRRAIAAQIPAHRIIFSGVGKRRAEMEYALSVGILQFNIESHAELILLNQVASELGKRAAIAIRANPDVDAGTHDKISTGRKEDKFGIAWHDVPALYDEAARLDHIDIQGIAIHIGSQLTSLAPFDQAFTKIIGLMKDLRAKGHAITHLDLGGGLGIPYHNETPPSPAAYGALIAQHVAGLDCQISIEPGRMIAGNAGIFVTETLYEKISSERRFVIVDGAMNDLMRPALYDAYHQIIPVAQQHRNPSKADVVGPICETTDIFAKDRILPELTPGDLLAFRSAGAYGFVMASEYNTRPMPAEVLVDGKEYRVIRKRLSYEEIIGRDVGAGS